MNQLLRPLNDENGHTMISLRINTQSFRFTGLHQLEALGLQIPPNLVEEINQRKTQISQSETQSSQMFMQRAYKERPNYRPPPGPGAGTASNQPTHHRVPPPNPGPAARAQPRQPPPQPRAAPSTHKDPSPSLPQPEKRPRLDQSALNFPPPINFASPPPSRTQYSPPASHLTTPPPGVSPSAGHPGLAGQPGQQHLQPHGHHRSQPGSEIFEHTDPATHSFNGNVYNIL